MLTQIERLYAEFQSHEIERLQAHELPLVRRFGVTSGLNMLMWYVVRHEMR